MSKTIGLFVDVANLYYCIGKKYPGRKLDYKKYLEKTTGDDVMHRAFAYGAMRNDDVNKFVTALRHIGYEPKFKKPKIYETAEGPKESKRVNWNVGIAIDIVYLIDKIDVVIIGSSDSELVPAIEWIKSRGIKCVIMACGIPKELKEVCDQWIELDDSLLENGSKVTVVAACKSPPAESTENNDNTPAAT